MSLLRFPEILCPLIYATHPGELFYSNVAPAGFLRATLDNTRAEPLPEKFEQPNLKGQRAWINASRWNWPVRGASTDEIPNRFFHRSRASTFRTERGQEKGNERRGEVIFCLRILWEIWRGFRAIERTDARAHTRTHCDTCRELFDRFWYISRSTA